MMSRRTDKMTSRQANSFPCSGRLKSDKIMSDEMAAITDNTLDADTAGEIRTGSF